MYRRNQSLYMYIVCSKLAVALVGVNITVERSLNVPVALLTSYRTVLYLQSTPSTSSLLPLWLSHFQFRNTKTTTGNYSVITTILAGERVIDTVFTRPSV